MNETHGRRWSLPADPSSVATARLGAVAQLRLWGCLPEEDACTMTVELVVSELVTNALRHTQSRRVTLVLLARAHSVFLDVLDGSAVRPVPRVPGDEEETGRGLALVAAVATGWGSHRTPRGKGVWATCALLPRPSPSRRGNRLARIIRILRPRTPDRAPPDQRSSPAGLPAPQARAASHHEFPGCRNLRREAAAPLP